MSTLALSRSEQTLQSDNLSSISLMRFNPSQRTLSKRVVGLSFKIGAGNADYLNSVVSTGTDVQINKKSAVEAICWDATTIYQSTKLPTIGDYENVEDLNDIEQIENLLYQTSQKFSW